MENIKCDYGCGLPFKFVFKNSNKCCSENANSCPAKRKKDSELKSGKCQKWKNGHPRGNKGKYKLRGKTWDEIYGKDYSEIRKKIQSDRIIRLGIKITPEQELLKRDKARKNILERYANGWEVRCGRTKKIDYESKIAGKVKLDGNWELASAKYFDSIGVKWIRNKKRFEYYNEIKNTNSTYCPDFYIEDWNTYIEVKGYTTELDLCKWKQFTEILEIWDKKKMKELNLI